MFVLIKMYLNKKKCTWIPSREQCQMIEVDGHSHSVTKGLYARPVCVGNGG